MKALYSLSRKQKLFMARTSLSCRMFVIVYFKKVKNDHRSKFSNVSNWKEEAWKKSGLQRDSNPWPPRYRCVAHGFESRWSPDFFQASSFQLLKLKNLLRWSFFTFISYNRSWKWLFHIYFTSYIFLASQRLVPVFKALFSSIHGQTLVMMSWDS